MALVNTVTGPVADSDLGRVLIHEHVFCALPGYELDFLDPLDEDAAVAIATERVRAVRQHGVRTIVDATPMNWYRRPDLLRRISEEAEVHIITTTGLYTEAMGIPFHLKRLPAAELAERFIGEIESGTNGSDIKAGVVKFAGSTESVSDYERVLIEAVVQTQKRTGVGIITHSHGELGGLEQVKALQDAGADMSRLMVGHLDNNSSDPDYFTKVAATGAWLGFDRIGHFRLVPHEDRHRAILQAFQNGLGSQVLLSHDFVAAFKGGHFYSEEDPDWAARAQIGYRFVFEQLVPHLLENGVSQEAIDAVFTDHPRRLLAGTG